MIASSGAFKDDNPFRFSSEYFDSETSLVYYNYRYYNPVLGRWLSRDPIAETGGFNLYGMVNNNIINRWDWLGYGGIPGEADWTPESESYGWATKAASEEMINIYGTGKGDLSNKDDRNRSRGAVDESVLYTDEERFQMSLFDYRTSGQRVIDEAEAIKKRWADLKEEYDEELEREKQRDSSFDRSLCQA